MKKRLRFILLLASYILSALVSTGILTLIDEIAPGQECIFGSHSLLYLISLIIAVPLNIFLMFPSIRAFYLRRVRKKLPANSVAKSIRKYGDMLPQSGSAVFMLKDDPELTVVNASPGFWGIIGMAGAPAANKRSISLASVIHPDDVDGVRSLVLSSDVVLPHVDFRIIRHDGTIGWCRIGGVKEELIRSGIVVTNCVAIDISDFINTENELQLERERYQLMLNNLGSAVWEYRVDKDEFFFLSRHMTNGKFRRVRNMRTTLIREGTIHPDYIDEFYSVCDKFRSGTDIIFTELRLRNHSGNYNWYTVSGNAVKDGDGRALSYIGQIKQAEQSSHTSQSSNSHKDFDALTHLSNRYAFESSVNSLLRRRGRNSRGALFVLNVDKFNRINTSLGRLFGDALLIELSEALKTTFPQNSNMCRISGDEFAVYVDSYESEEKIFELAGTVCGCVKHCFINTDQSESVTCCVGVALFPNHGTSFEQLFFKADSALIYAKHRGPGNYYVYSAELDSKLSSLSPHEHTHEEPLRSSSPSISFRDDSLLSQAIDILFDSRELSSSINLIISLIGRRFKLDRAFVLEFSDDNKHATITYRWHSAQVTPEQLHNIVMPIEDGLMQIHCTSRDEYFICNDMKAFGADHPDVAPLIEEFNVKAMLQCPIFDGNELIGCFSYFICRDDASFNESDVSQILMITKIIIGYYVRLRSKQDIDRITYRDKLTGAMNFTAFQMEMEKLLSSTSNRSYAIIYSDIDRFKFINEKYGYLAGDNILCSVAEIYKQNMAEGEFFARVTADKFIALLRYSSPVELDRRINAIHDSINHIKKTENTCYYLPVRSGVYRITPTDNSISGMIDLANLARKSVKNIHISTISYFNENMKSRLKRQKDIEQVMADALVQEEFVVYYQPKFHLSNKSLAGAEALVRWKRPDAGMLRPDEFIPIFEENGFVIELDFYVLERVCRKLRRDIDNHLPVLPISVNFSRTHIATDDLITRLSDCLKKYDIPPNLVEIEITESALTENESYLVDMIGELHNIGLIVSMDDFGSGFSSLNLLKKLPVDVLKIDKNFFASDSATERERCIIENVVNMARTLGINVVSEGVETAEQANFLSSIKCDLAQGYLFSPPIDEQSFERTYQHVDY